MGVFNKAIPDINLNDKDEPVVEYQQPVYIDDMFDPLFNKNVRNYLKDKYKYPIYRTLAGFAEGLDNALVPSRSQGQWGIMGPSMGILSNFGRTMDKAGDFLIGGVTEGINATSKLLGNDVEVNNPLKEIFVNDEDYSGQRLLASMTNSMSKLAGGTKVDESAFRGMWAIPSTALELALDPGVLGGSVARRLAPTSRNLTSREILHNIGNKIGNDNFKGAVGDVAQLLSNYDDIMTKIAFDYTAPGLRPAVKKFAHHINSTLGNYSTKPFIDVIKEYVENNPDVTDFDISKINMHNIDNIDNMDTPSVPPTINQTDNVVVNNINENSTPFPTYHLIERPDTVASSLLEGKIAIIVDTSPYIIILPAFLTDFINPVSDDYGKSVNVNFIRILRFIAFLTTLLAPAIYIALINYNQETIPLSLLINFATQRDGVPFPAPFEAIVMLLLCEILRESDIRFPSSYGSSISILGALLLGDAAVNAGIVSPIMIIVVAITFITGLIFTEIEMINSTRHFRFLFLIVASFFGLYGITIAFILLLIHLCSINPLDRPYTYPLAPSDKIYFNKTILKKNKIKDKYRAKLLSKKNKKKLGDS